jgi:NRAMP (natural resistance-associated macrophage protein)-like metal ion transporter
MATKKADNKLVKILKVLGPGLVTGASDDDPSGIATYSQVGAQFGFATLWTALITFPLMTAIQEMCARIGLVTSKGLTSTLRDHYPKWILWLMIGFSFPAIILNIGADIAGMGAAANLMFKGVPAFAFSIVFTALIIVAVVYFPYQKIAGILKWVCITLLIYLVVPFFTHVDWGKVAKATFIPHLEFSKDYISMLVAILGTTISPYLFFWQATMEAEDVKQKGGLSWSIKKSSIPCGKM